MSMFNKKRGKATPAISTASLPDIIFMLLFFFMVVTVLRDAELKVSVNTPSATELTKLEKKSLVSYIYIGKPVKKYQATYGTSPMLQLGDKISDINDIAKYVEEHRLTLSENERPAAITSLRVDKEATMGLVTDVKTELRKINQLKVNYSAKPSADR